MALLVKQNIVATGWTDAFTAAAIGGDHIFLDKTKNYGYIFKVVNGAGVTQTVTIPGVRRQSDGTFTDQTIAVLAGETWQARILESSKDADSGRVDFTYDAVATLTVAVQEA